MGRVVGNSISTNKIWVDGLLYKIVQKLGILLTLDKQYPRQYLFSSTPSDYLYKNVHRVHVSFSFLPGDK